MAEGGNQWHYSVEDGIQNGDKSPCQHIHEEVLGTYPTSALLPYNLYFTIGENTV